MKTWLDISGELELTAELYDRRLSDAGATMLLADLRTRFTANQVSAALGKCRTELRTFPTIADIATRVDDGRPGAEEAWAMIPKDEDASVVWTEEMARAFGIARALLEGDPIAARMAFKEAYAKEISDARAARKPPRWIPSLGFEKSGRQAAIQEAIDKCRIEFKAACLLLPDVEFALPVLPPVQLEAKMAGSGTEATGLNASAEEQRGRPVSFLGEGK